MAEEENNKTQAFSTSEQIYSLTTWPRVQAVVAWVEAQVQIQVHQVLNQVQVTKQSGRPQIRLPWCYK